MGSFDGTLKVKQERKVSLAVFFIYLFFNLFLMTLDFTILNSTIHYNTLLTILFTYTNNNTMYHLRLITYITYGTYNTSYLFHQL